MRLIVESARKYPVLSIAKDQRILLWGSFISAKPEPGDLDYSIVVDPRHRFATIEPGDKRFFVPFDARVHYGVEPGYLVLYEYPLETFAEIILFFCEDRDGRKRGILEVSCHG